jgi:Flp pilus assembly protein TadD
MRWLTSAVCAALTLGGCAGISSPGRPTDTARLSMPAANANTPRDETALYLNVVDGLVKQKRYGAAIAFLDGYAAKRKNFEARYWLLRGKALLGLGRGEDARAAYAELDGTPLAAEGWNGKGQVAAARLEWRDAAANFREAVRSEPANPDFLNNLAFADMHFGECDASATYLRQAWELKPDSSLIRNNLLIALTLTGDQAAADAILRTVKDTTERQAARTIIDNAIKDNGLTKDGTS